VGVKVGVGVMMVDGAIVEGLGALGWVRGAVGDEGGVLGV